MARQSTEVQVFGAVLAFVLVGTLCGLWIYSDIRTTEATVDVLRASERAIERISAAPVESVDQMPAKGPQIAPADSAARDSASHACVAAGYGPLKIQRIAVAGDRWDISGTAGKQRVVVHLREFTGPRGSATFRVQHVERL
jgi:hypothetical protein